MRFRRLLYQLANKNRAGRTVFWKTRNYFFPGSAKYWEKRYSQNGNSGVGSYGDNALYKADFLNRFVDENEIGRVLELGCGDGNQLKLLRFKEYIGVDVSPTAIRRCQDIFRGDVFRRFLVDGPANNYIIDNFHPELAVSLDVIYHLVEDLVFEKYMKQLFQFAEKYVIIYAWDTDEKRTYHVRHRKFSRWIEQNITGFALGQKITHPDYCDFFVYKKI